MRLGSHNIYKLQFVDNLYKVLPVFLKTTILKKQRYTLQKKYYWLKNLVSLKIGFVNLSR